MELEELTMSVRGRLGCTLVLGMFLLGRYWKRLGLISASSWNKDLAHQRAHFMGSEAKIKGVNILLGPMAGPVGRVVRGGRNWEGKEKVLHDEGILLLTECV